MKGGWRSEAVRDALDLCLACKGCKGCKTDCPANVDMATYKAEFLAHHWKGRQWRRPRSDLARGWLPLAARALPLVMLALGLAVQEAIAQVTGLAPDLRWPNDVLLGEKKCAGILAQLEGDAVVAGIGINVNQSMFPTEVTALATSLHLAGAGAIRREDLLVAVVEAAVVVLHLDPQAGGAGAGVVHGEAQDAVAGPVGDGERFEGSHHAGVEAERAPAVGAPLGGERGLPGAAAG